MDTLFWDRESHEVETSVKMGGLLIGHELSVKLVPSGHVIDVQPTLEHVAKKYPGVILRIM